MVGLLHRMLSIPEGSWLEIGIAFVSDFFTV